LLWVIVFASLATIVFQEMAARIGVVFGDGLGQAIAKLIENRFLQFTVSGLVVVAILIGNAAYQTGNIQGAAKGVEILIQPDVDSNWKATFQPWAIGLIGTAAAWLILLNRFELLQRALTGLVVLMSLLFLSAACLTRPSIAEIAGGLIPSIPKGSAWILVGVLGTTVVPYNLFLHASLAARQWRDTKAGLDTDVAIRHARLDTIISVTLGGIVTSAILLTAANAFSGDRATGGKTISDVGEIAIQLEPLLGSLSNWLFGIGLFAAGLTSAITAPVAGAYAAAGCFGWPNRLGDWRLRTVAISIIAVGVGTGIFIQKSPAEIIALAQVANGLLLPVLAVLLVVVANQTKLMDKQVNSRLVNVLAIATIAVIFLVAIRQLKAGFGF
jgi:NRAMP (natural resistance-associated macrophage protein)-like metal ion transporter